jgi:hypothetical protein
MHGVYVFRVSFRLPAIGTALPTDVSVRPDSFETTFRKTAAEPGEPGWLFFRDNCWRGDVADHEHACEMASDALGIPVDTVEFRSLRADPEYHAAFRDAIAADLDAFNAESVDEALTKYLGSSVDVVDDPDV